MKLKLSIFTFTAILSIFYFQIISCKNPEKPEAVYSNYTGVISIVKKSIFDVVENDYYMFKVNLKEKYIIAIPSDMDKLKNYVSYVGATTVKNTTIKATYSNHYKYKITCALNEYGEPRDNYLFDIEVIKVEDTKL